MNNLKNVAAAVAVVVAAVGSSSRLSDNTKHVATMGANNACITPSLYKLIIPHDGRYPRPSCRIV